MRKERVVIDQKMCRMVELMLKGGAPTSEIGEQLGISKATISRIKTAGFSALQYAANTALRRLNENAGEILSEVKIPDNENVQGQIQMEMPVDYTEAARMEREITTEKPEMSDQVKMMRFVASQVDKVIMKLDQIYNMQSMILRAVRKE